MPTFDTNKRTLGDLLSLTNPPIVVPEWQRNYSWTSREVETFWLDLLTFSRQYPDDNILGREYFLGSIVLVLQPRAHLLLDGQQRAATATILLSVIRDFLAQYRADAATRVAQRYITDFDDASETHRYKITLNEYDRDFFRNEVQEEGSSRPRIEPTLESHSLIRRAREFFEDQFNSKYQQLGAGETAFRWTLGIQRVLTDHIAVVVVTSDDEDSAATVFETLNDRGIGLSTPDLLRNLLLRRANVTERDEIVDCWRDVLDIAEDAAVEDFLRHYWLSRQGDIKTRRLYREMKSHIEASNTNSLVLSRELRQAAAQYRDLVAARHLDPEIVEYLEGVQELGAKSLLPALMSAQDVGTVEEVKRVLRALLAFFVRHNVIGNFENSKLETVAYKLAKELRDSRNFDNAVGLLRDAVPPLERFRSQFESASVGRQKTARYVLGQIERRRRTTEELEIAQTHRVHLEHIYPQTPEDERWVRHSQFVNRLGNLTLLSSKLNQSIKNRSFAYKRSAYADSEIFITKELADLEKWDPEEIDKRQARLANVAQEIWSLPGETETA